VSKFYLRLPSIPEDLYYEVDTDAGSPAAPSITQLVAPPTAALAAATPQNVIATQAPYAKLLPIYIRLVTSQYQKATKFITWLSDVLSMLTFADDFINNTFPALFDIDTSTINYSNQIGKILVETGGALLQEDGGYLFLEDYPNPILDIIGIIVGQPRQVNFQPSNSVSPILDDATYSILLKATIAKNNWDGNIDSLQGVWQQLFPGGTISITDNQDMTMSSTLKGGFTNIIVDLINNGYIIPKPQGVSLNLALPVHPLWGWGRSDIYVSGWGEGRY
jgi:hypothetical protein